VRDRERRGIDLMTERLVDLRRNVLRQRPARRDVDDLQSAAHREQRRIARESKLCERQLVRIARGVRFVRFRMPRVAVVRGVDVAAAGEEHAVEAVECRRRIHGEHTRVAAGAPNGFDVVGQPVGRRDADDGHYILGGTPMPMRSSAASAARARTPRRRRARAGRRLLLVEDRIPVIEAVEHLCEPERVFREYGEFQCPNDLLDDFIEDARLRG
jgi:hypothetical protein